MKSVNLCLAFVFFIALEPCCLHIMLQIVSFFFQRIILAHGLPPKQHKPHTVRCFQKVDRCRLSGRLFVHSAPPHLRTIMLILARRARDAQEVK